MSKQHCRVIRQSRIRFCRYFMHEKSTDTEILGFEIKARNGKALWYLKSFPVRAENKERQQTKQLLLKACFLVASFLVLN